MNVIYSLDTICQSRIVFEDLDKSHQDLSIRSHNRISAFFLNLFAKIFCTEKIVEIEDSKGNTFYLNKASLVKWLNLTTIGDGGRRFSSLDDSAILIRNLKYQCTLAFEKKADKLLKEAPLSVEFAKGITLLSQASKLNDTMKKYFEERVRILTGLKELSQKPDVGSAKDLRKEIADWNTTLTSWETKLQEFQKGLKEPFAKLGLGAPYENLESEIKALRTAYTAFQTASVAEKPIECLNSIDASLNDQLQKRLANHDIEVFGGVYHPELLRFEHDISLNMPANKTFTSPQQLLVNRFRSNHQINHIFKMVHVLHHFSPLQDTFDQYETEYRQRIEKHLESAEKSLEKYNVVSALKDLSAAEILEQRPYEKDMLGKRIKSLTSFAEWYESKYEKLATDQTQEVSISSSWKERKRKLESILNKNLEEILKVQADPHKISVFYEALLQFIKATENANLGKRLWAISDLKTAISPLDDLLTKLGFALGSPLIRYNIIEALVDRDFIDKLLSLCDEDVAGFSVQIAHRIALSKLENMIEPLHAKLVEQCGIDRFVSSAKKELLNNQLQDSIRCYESATRGNHPSAKEHLPRLQNVTTLNEWAIANKIDLQRPEIMKERNDRNKRDIEDTLSSLFWYSNNNLISLAQSSQSQFESERKHLSILRSELIKHWIPKTPPTYSRADGHVLKYFDTSILTVDEMNSLIKLFAPLGISLDILYTHFEHPFSKEEWDVTNQLALQLTLEKFKICSSRLQTYNKGLELAIKAENYMEQGDLKAALEEAKNAQTVSKDAPEGIKTKISMLVSTIESQIKSKADEVAKKAGASAASPNAK